MFNEIKLAVVLTLFFAGLLLFAVRRTIRYDWL